MKKVLLVFGTRPEAIKMAPLVKEFQRYPEHFKSKVCVTAQHRHMLDQVLDFFGITPDYDLNIMAPNQDLFDVTTKVLLGVRNVIESFNPDIVLVHGDTTTSLAASLAAFYSKKKIGHVEAGLRTYDLQAPWPEEMNRQVTDRICDFYFAPTKRSRQNLLDEGIAVNKIMVTGNTVIDALLYAVGKIDSDISLQLKLASTIEDSGYSLKRNTSKIRDYILVTGHRRENFGEGFLNICAALRQIAIKHPEIDVVYPVHLNPNVQKPVYDLLSDLPNVFLISPLDYLPFIYLMQHSKLVLTDSGGIQEEAPSIGKPVLVMRNTTERPEAVDAGTVKLVGNSTKQIFDNVENLLANESLFATMTRAHNPYGDGNASRKVVNYLK